MSGRAFIVVGAESTGTRLITELLVANGVWGQHGHDQLTDRLDPRAIDGQEMLVIRRSVPHRQVLPNLEGLLNYLYGYDCHVVVTFRAWDYASKSQKRTGHAPGHQEALDRIQEAYKHIFSFINSFGLPYTMFSFDALLADHDAQQIWLLKQLGLKNKKLLEIKNANGKWIKN